MHSYTVAIEHELHISS